MNLVSLRGTHIILLAYKVSNKETFTKVTDWYNDSVKHKCFRTLVGIVDDNNKRVSAKLLKKQNSKF